MGKAYNKIFFHTGVPASLSGWGDLVRQCDAAGIPVSIMSTGGEGVGDIVAQWDAGSTVPHNAVIRYMPKSNWFSNDDVPNYGANVYSHSREWWQWQKSMFGPEVFKYHDRIILKQGNELDKNWSDWLGRFFVEVGKLAINDDDGPFIIAPFGFASGEPEREHWQAPGMLAFLRFAEAYPENILVCLHEYSYHVDDILYDFPYYVGRFKMLFEVCDQYHIARPDLVFHEWGWEQDKIPEKKQALASIDAVAGLYARYPEIRGAGLWTTQQWQNTSINKQVQELIPGVRDLTLTRTYPVDDGEEETYKVVVWKLAQEHTKTHWEQIGGMAHDNYKRSQTASTDDLIRYMTNPLANQESYALVIDPEFPSQVEAIEQLEARDLAYKIRYLFTQPSNAAFKYTVWPTDVKRVTQRFGENPDDYAQFGLPGHEGIDLAAPYDTPYYAPAGGVVIKASNLRSDGSPSAYGYHVIIDHENGFSSLLAHAMPNLMVKVGDRVLAGDIVALSGNTGNSFGSHLHLTLKKQDYITPGWECCPGYIDPWPFLEDLYTPVPEPPPAGEEVDLSRFMIAHPLAWRVVKHPDGRQEDVQDMELHTSTESTKWVRRKNDNGEWWEIKGGSAWLIHDTSPAPDSQGNDRVYTLYKNDLPGAPKNPMTMNVGKTWLEFGTHFVQFRKKNGCANLLENSGEAANSCTLVSYQKNYTFNTYQQNLTIDEVVFLQTGVETQVYGFHNGMSIGWIGWQAPWGKSEIVELHTDRGMMAQEPNRFCDF